MCYSVRVEVSLLECGRRREVFNLILIDVRFYPTRNLAVGQGIVKAVYGYAPPRKPRAAGTLHGKLLKIWGVDHLFARRSEGYQMCFCEIRSSEYFKVKCKVEMMLWQNQKQQKTLKKVFVATYLQHSHRSSLRQALWGSSGSVWMSWQSSGCWTKCRISPRFSLGVKADR